MGKFVIYSLDNCYWSEKAKHLFINSKTKNKVINVNKNNKQNYTKLMQTFPQIYYFTKTDRALIGGYEDFVNVLTSKDIDFRIPPKNEKTLKSIKSKLEIEFSVVKDELLN
jgi:glutaredoxin